MNMDLDNDIKPQSSSDQLNTASKRKRKKPGPRRDCAIVDVPAARCPKCGSVRRGKYSNCRRLPINDIDAKVLILRRTHCLDCGQHRIDRTRE